jgi:tripartite ATP-independent transporter DctM subunit
VIDADTLLPAASAAATTGPERWLARAIEGPAALAVVAEVVILFAGIAARFVFNRPLVWSDELASILFLWLAMFGAAAALRHGHHMRLTFLASRLPPRWQGRAEALAVAGPALFLLLILAPAFDYARTQAIVVTPALGWSGLVRALAMPVGCLLILAECAMRLLRQRARDLIAVALVLGIIAAALWLWTPQLQDMGNWNLLVFFVGLLAAAVFAGVPIAFAFGLATVAYLLMDGGTPLTVVIGRLDEGMSSLILLAVPLFVLLGQLIEMTGMARVMVAFLAALLGHVRGGLSFVLLGAMLLVSGISGSKAADMAAVAPVLFPEMKRRGEDEGEMISLLAASGAMSETIPPSIVLIAIGSVTGVSIAALFTAGLLPGIVIALVLALVCRQRARPESTRGVRRAPWRTVLRSFVVALPALVLPFLVRAAVVQGIATATEVSTIGIAYALVVGILIYRQFDWRRVGPMLVQTASLSGAILLIVGAASAMSWALTQSGFSQSLAAAMAAVPGGRWGFLGISIVAFVVLGSVLEGIPAMVLFGPLLFPVAQQVGVHEVHYAIVAVLAMGVGLFAPPVGLGYYAACIIGRVAPDVGMRRIWPYLGAVVVGLLIVAAVPWIATGFL